MNRFKRVVRKGTRSEIVAIPVPIKRILNIAAGDEVEWIIKERTGEIILRKSIKE